VDRDASCRAAGPFADRHQSRRPWIRAEVHSNYRGHEYAHRTYYYRGAAYPRYYRTYAYRGVYLSTYAPARYYSPAFYGWVYYPWATPVYYRWVTRPLRGTDIMALFSRPYQSYPSASYWLTDYCSESLTAAYQEGWMQVRTCRVPLTLPAAVGSADPEVKQEIAAEVQRQLTLGKRRAQSSVENSEPDPASSGVPRLLSDNNPTLRRFPATWRDGF